MDRSIQSQAALNAESFMLFIVPSIACVVCIVALWFWDIDKKIAELKK